MKFEANDLLPLFVILSFLAMFGVQYLCCRAQNALVRHLPWLWVIGILILAVAALFGDTGGWIDLRRFFCAVLCGYSAICAAAIGLAHLVYRFCHRQCRRYE